MSALAIVALQAAPAAAAPPQDPATVDSSTKAGTEYTNRGSTGHEPDAGAGPPGGDADGWDVVVNSGAWIDAAHEGALVNVYAIGGDAGNAAQGGDGQSPGAAGGKGGDSGSISFTASAPDDQGSIWALYQRYGASNSYALDIRTIAGNGGKGETPGAETEEGGPAGAAGTAGDISFIAQQNGAIPSAYNYLYSATGSTGLYLFSQGGTGGDGGDTMTHVEDGRGVIGAIGSKGGDITASIALNMSDNAGNGVSMTSIGGDGGQGGDGNSQVGKGIGGAGGAAGNGGNISFNQLGGSIGATGSASTAAVMVEIPNEPNPDNPTLVPATLYLMNAAIAAQSIGGNGGNDGGSNGVAAASGAGGAAGDGGVVSVNLVGSGLYQTDGGYATYRDQGAIHTSGDNTVGVIAASIGGAGGGTSDVGGAFAKHGGKGGIGGDGQLVYVSMLQQYSFDPQNEYTLITTNGSQSDAVIAQSIGGGGGTGGDVHGGGLAFTVQHGGRGGSGGKGGYAAIDNGSESYKGYQIHTLGFHSFGLLAQSIGGGGGRGGSAFGIDLGVGALTIGGTGGSGGDALGATISNYGIIQTEGLQSIGIFAQSVGGGGGAGGSAVSVDVGSIVTVAVAIGGGGGAGGNGGEAQISNFGQVMTAEANAIGLVAQSIGGGGGNAGFSIADIYSVNPPDTPSVSVSVALGGTGGVGGVGNAVNLYNSGLIATQGDLAYGALGQSIGGGGGNGGDATAMAMAVNQSSITANVAIGGDSDNGSTGGTVTLANSGLLLTSGMGSIGLLAQSVGGGGGTGGTGQTDQGAYNDAEGYSASIDVAVGGKGGTGGDGGNVFTYNYLDGSIVSTAPEQTGSGSILTGGISAHGILAQSIGGGGGQAGNAIGKGGGGTVSGLIAIGGSGGAGGDGGDVTVDNGTGLILTVGANAHGIFAQSVGGGGGNGGNATTGSGDNPTVYYPQWLATQGADALGNQDVTEINSGFWDWKKKVTDFNDQSGLQSLYDEYQKANQEEAPEPASNGNQKVDMKIDVGAGRAGNGGAAGMGGTIDIYNDGGITTYGAGSYGMFGQSVGAGGGTAGVATAATSSDKPDTSTISAAIALGAASGSNGDGGFVSLTNGGANNTTASITTSGDLAHAMFGQSVGGGGGVGGASSTNKASGPGYTMVLGADSSSGGVGGNVQLDNDGQISTSGDHAYGMLAQSIGGGGGLGSVTGQAFDTTTGIAHSMTSTLQDGVSIVLGTAAAGSNGGTATVNLHESGSIHTTGVNAFGIAAQSIGGGGGIMIVDVNVQSFDSCAVWSGCGNQEVRQSDGGYVSISTDTGSTISTTGAGAVGIFAQAIGGGAATVNGMNGIDLLNLKGSFIGGVPNRGSSDKNWNAGNAGYITMQVNGDITTTGAYAHGIFAQAAANGGGLIGRENGNGALLFGAQTFGKATTCNTYLCPGHISITVGDGSSTTAIDTAITVSGANAYGVAGLSIAQSEGGNSVHLTVNSNGAIFAKGEAAGAVLIVAGAGGGKPDVGQGIVDNYGLIDASGSSGKIAVQGWSGIWVDPDNHNYGMADYPYVVNNHGTIRGSVVGGGTINGNGPQSVLNNMAGAVFEAGPAIEIGGILTNAGTLHIGAAGEVASTVLSGHLNQLAGGTLHIDADIAGGKSDTLSISGTATIAGTVHVVPTSVSNRSLKVLSAASGLTLDPSLAMTDSSHLYDFRSSVSGKDMSVSAVANFKLKAAGFGANEKSVAAGLQSLFDGGASADTAFTRLLAVADDAGYAAGLKSLAGQGLGAFGAFRFNSSRTFASNLYGGCAALQLDDRITDRCGWARVLANTTTQNAATDTHGYKADAWALQMGGQTPLSDDIALTGSLAYEGATFRDDSRTARIKGDTLLAGLGLLYTPARLELSAGIDAAYGWYKSRRTISLGLTEQANASPKQSQIGGHVRGAFNLLDEGKSFVRPFVEGHAIHVSNKAFTETGSSPFRLAVEGRSDTALIGVAGVEMGTALALSGKVTLRPFASAALEYGSPREWMTTARFAEQPQGDSFDLKTAGPGTLGRFAIGADLIGAKNVAFSVQYAPELGKDFTSHSGTARLTIAF